MESKPTVIPPLKIFNLKKPREFIGDAQAWTTGFKSLRGVVIIVGEDIVQGKLIVIKGSIYEIIDFDKLDKKYNVFETMSLNRRGDL